MKSTITILKKFLNRNTIYIAHFKGQRDFLIGEVEITP